MKAIFSITIFLSAFLFFAIQPMVGKMVLPIYGGAPSTWNICMFFFQLTLLAGYIHAHVTVKYFNFKLQAGLFFILFFASLMILPFHLDKNIETLTGLTPAIRLLGRLILSLGLPLFAISCLSSLLQRWFSFSDNHFSSDPYFLYGAGNAGSLTALFLYPLFFEQFFSTKIQQFVWIFGFGLLGFMVIICGFILGKPGRLQLNTNKKGHAEMTWKNRIFWIFSAFVPSSLMLGVTSYITTDLMAIPLLYILPLSLYLLSFILAFIKRDLIPHKLVIRLVPFFLVPLVPSFFFLTKSGLILIPIHLCAFFFVALGCHGELARSRPSVEKLTEYYLYIAFGGVLGGLFNAFVYPFVFNDIFEYPLTSFFACLILIDFKKGKRSAYRFVVSYALLLVAVGVLANITHGKDEFITRNFYGVKKIKIDKKKGYRSLIHGVTVHGRQFLSASMQNTPLAYYHKSGPLGDVFSANRKINSCLNVAVAGLGAGSIAGYMKSSDNLVFYEIDPAIIEIADSTGFFSFLSNTKANYSIVAGDARLKLNKAKDSIYDMIVLDVFSSDAIPIHMLTREAIDLYLTKIKPDGILVFNLSNKYINLKSIIARHAKDRGLVCIYKFDSTGDKIFTGKNASEYAVMGKRKSSVRLLLEDKTWTIIEPDKDMPAWTDQYSNILNYLRVRKF